MQLKHALSYKSYGQVYIHSSVVFSPLFPELADYIASSGLRFSVFSYAVTELETYKQYGLKNITANIDFLLSLIKKAKVSVASLAEYDLTRYNKNIASLPKEQRLVIYGNKRAYTDFAVHCAYNTPIDVVLLTKVKDTYIVADSNKLRSWLVNNEYKAVWNPSVYTYSDKLQKGTILYYGDKRVKFSLGDNVSVLTGEGEVYKTSINGCLCKIYKRGILERGLTDKLSYVINRQKLTDKAAWPMYMVYNRNDQPIGFLMKKVDADSLANVMYTWNEKEWMSKACAVAYNICEAITLFHAQSIVVGDISPKDILLDKRLNVTFIDADSFQYDYFPCPGFMYEYRHKDLDPRMVKYRLRPYLFEYFSLAVILYELLSHGHFPNEVAQKEDEIVFGDDSSSDMRVFDYRYMQFPLAVHGHTAKATEASVRCWELIPEKLRALFVDVFNYNRIVSAGEWQSALFEFRGR